MKNYINFYSDINICQKVKQDVFCKNQLSSRKLLETEKNWGMT